MKNVDIDRLKSIFRHKGYCYLDLDDLFPSELKRIQEDLAAYNNKYWSYVIKYGDFEEDIPVGVFSSVIQEHHLQSIRTHSSGEFAFFFRRMSLDHGLKLPVADGFIMSKKLVNSNRFVELLQKVTGREIGGIDQFYITLFDKGDFLGVHNDGGNNIGIAINITRNWLPTFGGITHVVDQSMNIVDSLTPTFGKMFIFDSKNNNVPHFVSTVTSKTSDKRMSIIARFN